MIEQTLGKKYSQFVNILIFIFPIAINSVKVAGDIVLFILAMMGIFITISQKLSPFIIKDIKVFSYLTTGYFLAVCLSVLFSGKVTELLHFIPRDFYFLFAPFIALALYKSEINVNYLLAGVKVGLIVLGIIIGNQLLSGVDRPSGVINADVFANIAVSMFFIVFVFFQQESFKHKIITLISLLSGFFVIVVSGTRGAWVSLLLLLGVYLYFLYKQKTKSNKVSIIVVLVVLGSALSVFNFNQYANDRVNIAYTEASNWFSGDQIPNSVSIRLEMYSIAIDNAKDVPFFGHGLRTSNIVLHNKTPVIFRNYVLSYNHLHNAYLTNLYNGGIPLLSALLLLLFVPLRIFIKENSLNRENPVFIAGLLLTVGYASYGMVNILFGDVFMNAFYVFFLAIFLLLTAKSTKVS
jgi:O-antigen ligase